MTCPKMVPGWLPEADFLMVLQFCMSQIKRFRIVLNKIWILCVRSPAQDECQSPRGSKGPNYSKCYPQHRFQRLFIRTCRSRLQEDYQEGEPYSASSVSVHSTSERRGEAKVVLPLLHFGILAPSWQQCGF